MGPDKTYPQGIPKMNGAGPLDKSHASSERPEHLSRPVFPMELNQATVAETIAHRSRAIAQVKRTQFLLLWNHYRGPQGLITIKTTNPEEAKLIQAPPPPDASDPD